MPNLNNIYTSTTTVVQAGQPGPTYEISDITLTYPNVPAQGGQSRPELHYKVTIKYADGSGKEDEVLEDDTTITTIRYQGSFVDRKTGVVSYYTPSDSDNEEEIINNITVTISVKGTSVTSDSVSIKQDAKSIIDLSNLEITDFSYTFISVKGVTIGDEDAEKNCAKPLIKFQVDALSSNGKIDTLHYELTGYEDNGTPQIPVNEFDGTDVKFKFEYDISESFKYPDETPDNPKGYVMYKYNNGQSVDVLRTKVKLTINCGIYDEHEEVIVEVEPVEAEADVYQEARKIKEYGDIEIVDPSNTDEIYPMLKAYADNSVNPKFKYQQVLYYNDDTEKQKIWTNDKPEKTIIMYSWNDSPEHLPNATLDGNSGNVFISEASTETDNDRIVGSVKITIIGLGDKTLDVQVEIKQERVEVSSLDKIVDVKLSYNNVPAGGGKSKPTVTFKQAVVYSNQTNEDREFEINYPQGAPEPVWYLNGVQIDIDDIPEELRPTLQFYSDIIENSDNGIVTYNGINESDIPELIGTVQVTVKTNFKENAQYGSYTCDVYQDPNTATYGEIEITDFEYPHMSPYALSEVSPSVLKYKQKVTYSNRPDDEGIWVYDDPNASITYTISPNFSDVTINEIGVVSKQSPSHSDEEAGTVIATVTVKIISHGQEKTTTATVIQDARVIEGFSTITLYADNFFYRWIDGTVNIIPSRGTYRDCPRIEANINTLKPNLKVTQSVIYSDGVEGSQALTYEIIDGEVQHPTGFEDKNIPITVSFSDKPTNVPEDDTQTTYIDKDISSETYGQLTYLEQNYNDFEDVEDGRWDKIDTITVVFTNNHEKAKGIGVVSAGAEVDINQMRRKVRGYSDVNILSFDYNKIPAEGGSVYPIIRYIQGKYYDNCETIMLSSQTDGDFATMKQFTHLYGDITVDTGTGEVTKGPITNNDEYVGKVKVRLRGYHLGSDDGYDEGSHNEQYVRQETRRVTEYGPIRITGFGYPTLGVDGGQISPSLNYQQEVFYDNGTSEMLLNDTTATKTYSDSNNYVNVDTGVVTKNSQNQTTDERVDIVTVKVQSSRNDTFTLKAVSILQTMAEPVIIRITAVVDQFLYPRITQQGSEISPNLSYHLVTDYNFGDSTVTPGSLDVDISYEAEGSITQYFDSLTGKINKNNVPNTSGSEYIGLVRVTITPRNTSHTSIGIVSGNSYAGVYQPTTEVEPDPPTPETFTVNWVVPD